MRIQQLNCFGARPGQGNPALVIEADRSTTAARQAFARERNTTCVFIDGASAGGAAADDAAPLDFYYPHPRSVLCLHATLAAAHVLLARHGAGTPLAVRTALRGQRLLLSRDGG